jgi:hypothetical protein
MASTVDDSDVSAYFGCGMLHAELRCKPLE